MIENLKNLANEAAERLEARKNRTDPKKAYQAALNDGRELMQRHVGIDAGQMVTFKHATKVIEAFGRAWVELVYSVGLSCATQMELKDGVTPEDAITAYAQDAIVKLVLMAASAHDDAKSEIEGHRQKAEQAFERIVRGGA